MQPTRIARLSAEAGLECIEWAGDVHAPPGDAPAADTARTATEQAGIAVASYGSYLTFTGSDDDHAAAARAVLETAERLGAARIRVWAGDESGVTATAEHRRRITDRLHDFAESAGSVGIEVGLEFHFGTLTDSVGSTLQLLDESAQPNLGTYWQPNIGNDADEAIATLRAVRKHISTIHVFSWWPTIQRLPLAERADLWRRVFAELADSERDHDALLEFVPDDDPAILAREAESLHTFMSASGEKTR